MNRPRVCHLASKLFKPPDEKKNVWPFQDVSVLLRLTKPPPQFLRVHALILVSYFLRVGSFEMPPIACGWVTLATLTNELSANSCSVVRGKTDASHKQVFPAVRVHCSSSLSIFPLFFNILWVPDTVATSLALIKRCIGTMHVLEVTIDLVPATKCQWDFSIADTSLWYLKRCFWGR